MSLRRRCVGALNLHQHRPRLQVAVDDQESSACRSQLSNSLLLDNCMLLDDCNLAD
jgi:hypothetical protein